MIYHANLWELSEQPPRMAIIILYLYMCLKQNTNDVHLFELSGQRPLQITIDAQTSAVSVYCCCGEGVLICVARCHLTNYFDGENISVVLLLYYCVYSYCRYADSFCTCNTYYFLLLLHKKNHLTISPILVTPSTKYLNTYSSRLIRLSIFFDKCYSGYMLYSLLKGLRH